MNNKEDSLNTLYSDDNLFNLYLAKINDAYQNDKNNSYHIINLAKKTELGQRI